MDMAINMNSTNESDIKMNTEALVLNSATTSLWHASAVNSTTGVLLHS